MTQALPVEGTTPGTARRGATRTGPGIALALASAAAFGTSGAVARPLLDTGWSPGAVVTFRVGVAAVVLGVPTLLALRGRWGALRRNAGVVLGYGVFAVAGAQLAYFSAIQHLSVAVALLIEYLAPVLIVGYLWARTGRRPNRLTVIGGVLSLAGLALVLDLTGQVQVSLVGVLWALGAAMGLSAYFLLSDHGSDGDDAVPPLALAGAGLTIGAAVLVLAGVTGILPMRASTADVAMAGLGVPWWVAGLELALLTAAFAYVTGVMAVRRLGSTVGSFVALTEVMFAVLFAWLLIDQLPAPVQLLGGVLIVAGVVAVRLGETQRRRRARRPS
ncbi:MAG TPA: DMT family transporter [Actinomycetales bacterium]|nr:DMT family transporter [Actinomycetales bacterium]